MTDKLPEILARLEAATPGPWAVYRNRRQLISDRQRRLQVTRLDDKGAGPIATVHVPYGDTGANGAYLEREGNVEFIANAPTDISWLLGEVGRLREGRDWAMNKLGDDALERGREGK